MSTFTQPILSGVLIGFASAMLLLFNGRIAGVSGIVGGLLRKETRDKPWRIAFAAGLMSGGVIIRLLRPDLLESQLSTNAVLVIAAGLLVGYGTSMGSGCTSGHGICGIGRFSNRSILATALFIGAGILTTTAVRVIWSKL